MVEAVGRRIATLWPQLSERQRRLLLGVEARELGWGGVSAVARVAGVARSTVSLAVADVFCQIVSGRLSTNFPASVAGFPAI